MAISVEPYIQPTLPVTRPQAHEEEENDQSEKDGCTGDVHKSSNGGYGHALGRLHQDNMDS